MVMEYWTGWFDSWGGSHNILDSSGECFILPVSIMCVDPEQECVFHSLALCMELEDAGIMGSFVFILSSSYFRVLT